MGSGLVNGQSRQQPGNRIGAIKAQALSSPVLLSSSPRPLRRGAQGADAWQPGWPKGIFFPSLRRSGQVDPCFSSSLCSRSRGHQVCSGGSIRLAPGAPDLAPGPCPAVPVTMGEYFPVLGLRFPTCTLSSLAKSMILNFGHTLKSARDLLKIPGPRRHQRSIK